MASEVKAIHNEDDWITDAIFEKLDELCLEKGNILSIDEKASADAVSNILKDLGQIIAACDGTRKANLLAALVFGAWRRGAEYAHEGYAPVLAELLERLERLKG